MIPPHIKRSFAMILRLLALALILLFPTLAKAEEPKPIAVVASFSIIEDIVRRVGGDKVQVETIMGMGQDPHDFSPAPAQAAALTKAEIIVINCLYFEGWMHRLVKASETKAKLLVAGAGINPRILKPTDHDHHPGEKKEEMQIDPHAWQNLKNATVYARNIAGAFAAARPEWADTFKANAKAYIAEIEALDAQAKKVFAEIPVEQRKLVTTHDALGYFADAYGLTVLSPMGLNPHAQPSAKTLAPLIDQIKREGIRAVFLENMTDPRLIEQIAQETGAKVGGTLYTDSLTPEAPTYLAMMKSNIETISKALK